MKRGVIVGLVVLALAVVGAAAYWGARSVDPVSSDEIQVPPLVAVSQGDVKQTVTAPGTLVCAHEETLAAEVGGLLAELNVQAGDRVHAGDLLARLAQGDLEQAVAQARIDLQLKQLELEKLQRPVDEADLRQAQHAVDQAAEALGIAQAERDQTLAGDLFLDALPNARISYNDKLEWYESRQRLYEEGQLSSFWFVDQARREFEDVRDNLQKLEAEAALAQRSADSKATTAAQTYQEAKDDLVALQQGVDPLELEASQLAVESARADLDAAMADLAAASITAPFDGTITEIEAQVGDTVSAGSPLLVLSDLDVMAVETTVVEEDFPVVAVGQPVELFFDAEPDLTPMGQVTRIVPRRVEDDRPLYPVLIDVEASLPSTLAPGMTVDASIILASREDALRLPRAVVHAQGDGTATVKVWTGTTVEERTIRVGLRGDVFVEVLEGLSAGEQVVAQ